MAQNSTAFPPPLPRRSGNRQLAATLALVPGFLILLAVFVGPLFVWYGCRIEPGSDQIAILIRKTGTDLPSGEIIATGEGQKGIQLEVLSEGRYFKNPYTWGWKIHRVLDIPAGQLGIKTRLFGRELAPDKIIAEDGTKGIMPEVLRPGKYRINPYAYLVQTNKAISIRPGHVGVVTSLVGTDVLNSDIAPSNRNTFIVGPGMKGVLPEVLDPGTYYLHPFMVDVVEVNLQSQRFEMSGDDAISFLTLDGFTVTVEGTIEFAINRDKVALLTHRVGDLNDVLHKVIMPRARGFSRIEGSKHPVTAFIVGETRRKFQDDLDVHLRQKSEPWGVDVKSVLIRRIDVPDQIASISRDREVAVQDAHKYEQQIEQARSEAELVKQQMLAQQNKERVQADTARIQAIIAAKQEQEVRLISAQKDLEVARVDLEATEFQVEAIRLTADGERDAIHAQNAAEAGVLADQVRAFESGMNLARYVFYRKIGPRIESVLTSDREDGLGAVFMPFLPSGKEESK